MTGDSFIPAAFDCRAARTRRAIATRARKLGEGTLDLFVCEELS